MIRLTLTHAGESRAVELSEAAITLGRTHDNTVQIPDEKASREHCRIEQTEDGGYRLRDLDSRNGTAVNGQQVGETPLADGDRIRIGKTDILLEVLPEAAASEAPAAQKARAPADGEIQLVFLGGPGAGKTITVSDRLVTLGRQPKNDVVVDDPRASNRHAQIRRDAEGFVLVDTDSRNGTFVNGERITTSPIRPGDTIRIGDCRLRVARPGETMGVAAAPAEVEEESAEERTTAAVPLEETQSPPASPAEGKWRSPVPLAALIVAGAVLLLGGGGWLLLRAVGRGGRGVGTGVSENLLGERGDLRSTAGAEAWRVDEGGGSATSQGLVLELPARSNANALGAHRLRQPLSISAGKTYAVSGELTAQEFPDGQVGVLVAWLGDAAWAPRAEQFLWAASAPGADGQFVARRTLTAPPWADRLALACAARGRNGRLVFRGVTVSEEPSAPLPQVEAGPLLVMVGTPMTLSAVLDGALATAGAGVVVHPRTSRAALPAAHGKVASGFPKTEGGAYTCRAALPLQLDERSTRLWVEQTLSSRSTGLHLTCRVWTEDDAGADFVGLALPGPAPSADGAPDVQLSTGFVPWEEAQDGSLSDVLSITRPVRGGRLTVASETPLDLSVQSQGHGAVYRLGRQGLELRSAPFLLEFTLRGTDAAEEQRLAAALDAAERAAREGRLGEAMRRFATIAEDYPHRREGAERARGQLEALRRQANRALAAARRRLQRAEITQEGDDFAAARRQLDDLRATLEDTPLAKTARSLLERHRDAQSAAREQRQERLSSALLAAARRHQEQDQRHIARLHCEEILDRFPETPAAAEAQTLLDTLKHPPETAQPKPKRPSPDSTLPTPTEPRTP